MPWRGCPRQAQCIGGGGILRSRRMLDIHPTSWSAGRVIPLSSLRQKPEATRCQGRVQGQLLAPCNKFGPPSKRYSPARTYPSRNPPLLIPPSDPVRPAECQPTPAPGYQCRAAITTSFARGPGQGGSSPRDYSALRGTTGLALVRSGLNQASLCWSAYSSCPSQPANTRSTRPVQVDLVVAELSASAGLSW